MFERMERARFLHEIKSQQAVVRAEIDRGNVSTGV